jgi:lactoylglutathione lyase
MSTFLKNSNQVRLVSDLKKATEYYTHVLGFTVDSWGHAGRDNVGFLLQQASKLEHVNPNERSFYSTDNWAGPPTSWDTYCYTDYDGVVALYDELKTKGAFIAYDPVPEDMGNQIWLEFGVKDLDGYVIVIGGGKPKES